MALFGVFLATAGGAVVSEASYDPATVLFGCPDELGPMMITNVDCSFGVADAFDQSQEANTRSKGGESGRAPWCFESVDLTIYGCAAGCDDPAPSLHPDGMFRLTERGCGNPAQAQAGQG